MINPTELRIGNFINLKVEGKVDENAIVIEIGEDNVSTRIDGAPQRNPAKNLYGIQVDDDILRKSGFNLNNVASHAYLPNLHLEKATDGYYMYQTSGLVNRLNPIVYLHQLQNFFFALTGEELQINL